MKTLVYGSPSPASSETSRLPASSTPFANNPDLDHLRDDLAVNVSKGERIASAVAGLALMMAGRFIQRRGGFLRKAIGAMLVSRGMTGHCPLYYLLGQDTRHYPKTAK